MPLLSARHAIAIPLFLLLMSCGDQPMFMSAKSDASDLQIASASDGQVYASGKSVPLMVSARDTAANKDVEIDVTVSSSAGATVLHNRGAMVVNEQNPVALPAGLAPGLYRMDLVLYSSGQVIQKKSVSFFVADADWKITGIRSFPPVITTASTVMLKAELAVPADADPYLRWSWKGKVIQKGLLSASLGQILWDVPGEGGVYTITLELFPSAPAAGSDFTFTSSLSLSTDIIVSGGGSRDSGRLGPPADFITLLRLQGSLADSGAGSKKAGKTAAVAVGSPAVVSLEKGFGYRLDGSSGIRIPWLALPIESGSLRPFTLSLGVSFDDLMQAGSIVTAVSSDDSFSLAVVMDPQTSAPQLRITGAGAPVVVPWDGPALSAGQRALISLSVRPRTSGFDIQWFLDGGQVSRASVQASPGAVRTDGTVTIGGPNGFKGVVDEFGIYAIDPAGRPSTDPDLYARAQKGIYGSRLIFADGFDGMTLPEDFSMEGSGQLAGGSVVLPAGARLVLPSLPAQDFPAVTVALSGASGRSGMLVVQWEGAVQAPVSVPVSATTSGFKFRVGADGKSLVASGQDGGDRSFALPSAGSGTQSLVVKLAPAPDAKADLVIDSVLALSGRP